MFECTFRKVGAFYAMPDLHSHDFFELYYLASGERRYFIQDTVFTVHSKGFVFIKPGLLHKTSFSGHGVHTRYFASIPRSWLLDIESVLPPFFLCEDLPDLEYLFSLLQKESADGDDLAIFRCRAIASEIITVSFREYVKRNDESDDFVKNVAAFVNSNISGDLSLDSISRHMNLSPTYFSSLFHRKTGMKLSDFIRSSRVAVAAEVLEKGGLVKDASTLAGFSDPSYFKDVFRSVMKISPSSYKKQFAGDEKSPCGKAGAQLVF